MQRNNFDRNRNILENIICHSIFFTVSQLSAKMALRTEDKFAFISMISLLSAVYFLYEAKRTANSAPSLEVREASSNQTVGYTHEVNNV